MNVIFLEVVGVLNSPGYLKSVSEITGDTSENINYLNLKMLSYICKECNAKVVISSSWREFGENDPSYQHHMGHLKDMLDSENIKILSSTPILESTGFHFEKGLEISTWLKGKEDINFVILDKAEVSSMHKYVEFGLSDRLIKVSSNGLTKNDADNVIKMLKNLQFDNKK